MWINNLNPTLIDLGPVEIRYYGLVYFFCALFAYWWLKKYKNELKLNEKEISDLVFWLFIGVIIGARLFAVVFWDFNYYLSQPWWKFLAVWEGGLSFHGGLAGIMVAAYIYCKKKNIELLKLADILSFPGVLFLAIGRVANFINGELWGKVTNLPWGVKFPSSINIPKGLTGQVWYDYVNTHALPRHPYQLYEAMKRFIIAGYLLFLNKKSFKTGFIFWNFVFFEGLGRFILDFYNVEKLVFGLAPGQWLSLIMVIVSLYFLITRHKQDWKNF